MLHRAKSRTGRRRDRSHIERGCGLHCREGESESGDEAAETWQGEGEDEVVITLAGKTAETHEGKAAANRDSEAENAKLCTDGPDRIWIGKVSGKKKLLARAANK